MRRCPKCSQSSGDDWSQCAGVCPMLGSPHYDPGWSPSVTIPLSLLENCAKLAFYAGTTNDYEICRIGNLIEDDLRQRLEAARSDPS